MDITEASKQAEKHRIKSDIEIAEEMQACLISLINQIYKHTNKVAKDAATFDDTLSDMLDALGKSKLRASLEDFCVDNTDAKNGRGYPPISRSNQRITERY